MICQRHTLKHIAVGCCKVSTENDRGVRRKQDPNMKGTLEITSRYGWAQQTRLSTDVHSSTRPVWLIAISTDLLRQRQRYGSRLVLVWPLLPRRPQEQLWRVSRLQRAGIAPSCLEATCFTAAWLRDGPKAEETDSDPGIQKDKRLSRYPETQIKHNSSRLLCWEKEAM